MNIELLKKKMDRFFAETSTEQLIAEFEKMGYKFIDKKEMKQIEKVLVKTEDKQKR